MDSIYTIHNVKGGIKMKSITQRRIFSLLLSLAMLIGLLPALGSIASAAGSGTTEGDPRIVTTYAELSSALSSGVTYVKLGANINTKDFNDGAGYNKSIQQTGTVQLDLDGYSVTFFSRTSPGCHPRHGRPVGQGQPRRRQALHRRQSQYGQQQAGADPRRDRKLHAQQRADRRR